MIALARKYRPRRFADLLVQDHVANALRGAVARSRVGHGYLLTGPRGVGKTTAARILAMALNCEHGTPDTPPGEPCGACPACERIWSGSATLDVVEIDAASNRGVDDARDLRERAMYAPSQSGHHKVYIVDEAHMLTREAWNALLKILEEPPPGVIFVFATTEPQKIANTAAPVLSRLQRFDFRRISPAAIRTRLREVVDAEGVEAESEALALIARHADGGMRDALSLLDQCLSFGEGVTSDRVRDVLGLVGEDIYAEVVRLVAARDPAAVFPLMERLLDHGADLEQFVGGLGDVLRAVLLEHFGGTDASLTERMRDVVGEARASLRAEDAVRMLTLLSEAETAVRRSGSPRLVVETLLLRWALMDRTVDLERVVAGGAVPPPVPAAPTGSRPVPSRGDPGGPAAAPVAEGPALFTAEGVASIWAAVVEAGREESRFLGEALAASTVREVQPPEIRLVMPAEHAVLAGALEKGRKTIEGLLAARLGTRVRLRFGQGEGPPGTERRKRLSHRAMQEERLEGLRGVDPVLDAAVDELDLEIVDESPPRA